MTTTTTKSTTTNPTNLPPLIVSTGKLSTVGWIATFVTRAGRPIRVLDAPALDYDRGIRFECATGGASPLYVRIYLPLASTPGVDEARGMSGGLFDPAGMKALDGLGDSHEPAMIARRKGGLVIAGAAISAPIHLPPLQARFPALPVLGEPASAVEEPMNYLRSRVVSSMAGTGTGKNSMPENALAALAVLDRVAPATVRVECHSPPLAYLFSCQWDGLGVDIIIGGPRKA